jgi:hypothetical protein
MAIEPSFEDEQWGNSAVDFIEQYLHKNTEKQNNNSYEKCIYIYIF